MKKLIPVFSLVLGIIVATIIILLLTKDKKKNIVIESFDKKVEINLGKYKVKNYTSSTEDGINQYYIFDVSSGDDFLSFIKESPYYDSSLCFSYKNETFGYLIKEDRLFRYKVINKSVELRSIGRRLLVENSFDYYIAVMDSELATIGADATHRYEWHGKLSFDQIKIIMNKLGANLVEIKDDEIFLNAIFGVDYSYDGTKVRIYVDENGYLNWEYVK